MVRVDPRIGLFRAIQSGPNSNRSGSRDKFLRTDEFGPVHGLGGFRTNPDRIPELRKKKFYIYIYMIKYIIICLY